MLGGFRCVKGATSRFVHLEQFNLKLVICNPCQSSPSLTILVPFWFVITSLMFFYLTKLIFCGFPHAEGYFAHPSATSRARAARFESLRMLK